MQSVQSEATGRHRRAEHAISAKVAAGEVPLSLGASINVMLRSSIDWVRLIYITEDYLSASPNFH